MRVAFFSDIHGNLPALEAALADAVARGATHLICLGDIVGYGPQPVECVQRIRQVASGTVIGNHDAAVCDLFDRNCFNSFARETAERAMLILPKEDIEWLRALPYQIEGNGFFCTHGSFNEPEAFDYLSEREDAALSFSLYPEERLFFVGHTHISCVFALGADDELPRKLPPEDFTLQDDVRYIVNPGTIGFPRGESLTSDYVLFDTATRRVSFHRVPYDLAPYRLALVKNGYNLLNYWFLSPKASRRRTELAMRAMPTRRVAFDKCSGFSLQRESRTKWFYRFFYIISALLFLFMSVVLVLVVKGESSHEVDVENLVPPTKKSSLLGNAIDWHLEPKQACRVEIDDDTLKLITTAKEKVAFTLESPRLPLSRFGELSDAYMLSYSLQCDGEIDYHIRCTYYRANGTSVKGGDHAYKTNKPVQYTDKGKKDVVEVVITIDGFLHHDLTFRHLTLRPVL